MQIAERALLRDKKKLNQHRKKYPYAFEHIEDTPQGVIRYYSDEPAFRLGDALKVQLEKSGNVLDSLIFFQPFDDHWYGCVFEGGELEREFLGTIEETETEFSFELYQASQVLVTQDGLPFFPEKHVEVPPLNEADWVEFSLKPVKSGYQKNLAAVGLLALFGLIGGYLAFNGAPSKPMVSQPVNTSVETLSERQKFEQAFESHPLAHSYIESALAMLIEAQTLPKSMVLTGIHNHEDQLKGAVNSTGSRAKERRDWANKSTIRYVRWDESTKALYASGLRTQPWEDAVVDDYVIQAVDALELLGVDVEETSTTHFSNIGVKHYRLSGSTGMGKLHLIGTILNAPFVTGTNFSLSVQGNNTMNFQMEIDIQGVNLE